MSEGLVVVGIDVGGAKRGHKAVALSDGVYVDDCASRDPEDLAVWCRAKKALVVAVDAPCRWSDSGAIRQAELELRAEGMQCYATPTEQRARANETGFYDWVFAGMELFRVLEQRYRLFQGEPWVAGELVCLETFPHAATCALKGRVVSAKDKDVDRRAVLEAAGVGMPPGVDMDTVDAGVCALTAMYYAAGCFRMYGEPESGFIVVPEPKAL